MPKRDAKSTGPGGGPRKPAATRPSRKKTSRKKASRKRAAAGRGAADTAAIERLLRGLNEPQREAVTTLQGPLLVLAGAGTGKTRVITFRMANLLASGVPAENILAMTFTNKAAGEMRERVGQLVGQTGEGLTVSTFHSFCLEVLRAHKQEIGFAGGFSLCDGADQLTHCRAALRELHVGSKSLTPPQLSARISLLKNRVVDPEQALEQAGDTFEELVARGYRRYQDRLRAAQQLDFDDLLTELLRLYREHEEVLARHQERYQYLLVDEYQDTNQVQYDILRRLAGDRQNLCVVGDDDQSIYSWRGADITKILSFDKDYAGTKVVRLETNYRSTRDILSLANRLIVHNTDRHPKELRSHIGSGELVQAVLMKDEDYEAEYIVRQILELTRGREDAAQGTEGPRPFSDFAVLFRTAVQARCFEAELRLKDVPYRLVGGMSFFDRKEVRDLLAYLRLASHPHDEPSLLRALNAPPRGVGKTSLERALEWATAQGCSLLTAFQEAGPEARIPDAARRTVVDLAARMGQLAEQFAGDQLVALIERIVEEADYRREVTRAYPDPSEAEKRWQAVEELANMAEGYVRRSRKRSSLQGFLDEVTLIQDDRDKDDDRREQVTLMTLHASKGLEFPQVYLVGLEEGILPHGRAVAEDTIEEERRLCYVGITRAQRVLTLSYCNERARFGTRVPCHPSRFLFEIKGSEPPSDWEPALPPEEAAARRAKKKSKKGRRRRRASRA